MMYGSSCSLGPISIFNLLFFAVFLTAAASAGISHFLLVSDQEANISFTKVPQRQSKLLCHRTPIDLCHGVL